MISPATKNRYTAPFGYTIIKGVITVHPAEAPVVRRIFAGYLAGTSLQSIADDLTAKQVEYLPGKSDWNKGRIKRILEDARYLGGGEFPALVDEADFHAVQERKQASNTAKTIQPGQHISQITVPVACADCGTAMTRQHHAKLRVTEAWSCPCGVKIWLADNDLLAGITEILNRLIDDPALVTEPPSQPNEAKQLKVRRLQNEIGRQMEGAGFDRDAVQGDIFALAAAKFNSLPDHTTTHLLRAAFERLAPLDCFSRELLEATASQILLGGSGVYVKLKNGQIIGGNGHGSDSDFTENRADDPAEA